MKETILVTGASGLLGSYLLPLLEDDYSVWAISHSRQTGKANGSPSWINFDLSQDLSSLSRLLPEKIDGVIHLAQSPHFREFPSMAEHIFNVNIKSTMFLLHEAFSRGCKRFINASTGAVNSFIDGGVPFKEGNVELLPPGSGFYPVSKQCGEVLVNAYADLMNVINLRFFFIYGRGQNESMLIPRLVESVRQGTEISLQGSEGLRLNPVHASDAAKAVLQSLQLNGSHTINVAGKDIVSLKELGKIIGRSLHREAQFSVNLEQRAMDIVADISVMKELLLEPEIKLASGIEDYCRDIIEKE